MTTYGGYFQRERAEIWLRGIRWHRKWGNGFDNPYSLAEILVQAGHYGFVGARCVDTLETACREMLARPAPPPMR